MNGDRIVKVFDHSPHFACCTLLCHLVSPAYKYESNPLSPTCQQVFSAFFLLTDNPSAVTVTNMNTKLSFAFTPEDMKLIDRLKKTLAASQGKITNVTAIRYALREAVK